MVHREIPTGCTVFGRPRTDARRELRGRPALVIVDALASNRLGKAASHRRSRRLVQMAFKTPKLAKPR